MRIAQALTIAGSDSGGGAGIQADIKSFQEMGVFGMSVVTAVTAQNTLGVHHVMPMTVESITQQLDAIAADMGTDAVKTGMLYSGEIIEVVADCLQTYNWKQVVVDPVMIAKGGASLLQQEALHALKHKLLPLVQAVTPNIPEAEALAEMQIECMEDMKKAARRIRETGVSYVVMKGGHASFQEDVIDYLYDGHSFTPFHGRRVETVHSHGTGCTFSAVMTACLARGASMTEAVQVAKQFIQAALEDELGIGNGHGPTNHWAYRKRKTEFGEQPRDT
ncbi:bifunctional hydroxymethylpyrimidine kinase/phosphomethylpyrimidine kinase [Marinicrinis sediminis]|uniref:Hydroxymethylpyrimidine/phosphomethylpyrimidine kinase n=1 Tax=Marinicrinis sediminis TaxID=1652465 RepID=A0ABW5RD27_9BACL